MKKFFLFLFAVLALTFVPQALASGESNCQIVYGGGQVCQNQVKFTINKLVQKPGPTKGGGDFVENMTVNDPRFAPNQNVNFKIVVENTGNTDISNLNVVDTFPQFLTFVAGVGNTNAGGSQINFVIGSLKAGQKLEYVITVKTASDSQLPANQTITCVTNNVVATSSDGSQASDNSQLCIEKNIVVATPQILEKPFVKTIPSTGPEMGALFALIPAGALGVFINKLAKGQSASGGKSQAN